MERRRGDAKEGTRVLRRRAAMRRTQGAFSLCHDAQNGVGVPPLAYLTWSVVGSPAAAALSRSVATPTRLQNRT
jgi:hypothetical protein